MRGPHAKRRVHRFRALTSAKLHPSAANLRAEPLCCCCDATESEQTDDGARLSKRSAVRGGESGGESSAVSPCWGSSDSVGGSTAWCFAHTLRGMHTLRTASCACVGPLVAVPSAGCTAPAGRSARSYVPPTPGRGVWRAVRIRVRRHACWRRHRRVSGSWRGVCFRVGYYSSLRIRYTTAGRRSRIKRLKSAVFTTTTDRRRSVVNIIRFCRLPAAGSLHAIPH